MLPETAAALYAMHTAAERIVEALEGRAFEEFADSWLLQSAIERQFEVLGEALYRIRDREPEVYARFPEGPKIIGLRNVISHGYDAIDARVLWSSGEVHIPDLLQLLSNLLGEADRQGL